MIENFRGQRFYNKGPCKSIDSIESPRYSQKLMKRFGRSLLSFGLIVAGIFSAAFGLKGFLLSSRFIDGGVTGISMLLSDVLHAPFQSCSR